MIIMSKYHRRRLYLSLLAGISLIFMSSGRILLAESLSASNIILFIGDGTGLEQIKAGGYFIGSNLYFEAWTNAQVKTYSADSPVTDSAAGATAIATGHKVNNGVISVALPGDGSAYETMLEYFKSKGKRTGLVSTTSLTDATPAAFGAHATNRGDSSEIASDLLDVTKPNILLGGSGSITISNAQAAGYNVVTNASQLAALNEATNILVSGQFGIGSMPYEYDGMGTMPHLSDMVEKAIKILTNGQSGFFLMVEGARIDHACHANDITRCVREVAELNNAVKKAVSWASNRTDTLIVVTADHESGGLTVLTNNGAGNDPTVTWSTTGHTSNNVGLWIRGPKTEDVGGIIDNTNILSIVRKSYLMQTTATNITFTTNSVRMDWTSRTNDVFRLEATDDLVETNWVSVGVITATSDTVSVADTNMSFVRRFYRFFSVR